MIPPSIFKLLKNSRSLLLLATSILIMSSGFFLFATNSFRVERERKKRVLFYIQIKTAFRINIHFKKTCYIFEHLEHMKGFHLDGLAWILQTREFMKTPNSHCSHISESSVQEKCRTRHTLRRFIRTLMLSFELTYCTITAQFERSSKISAKS